MRFTSVAAVEPAPVKASKPRVAAAPATPPRMVVQLVDDPARLAEHVAAWDNLAVNALEPNVFYESWMLRPAVAAFSAQETLAFVFVYQVNPDRPRERPLLCALFPFERQRRYKRLPVSALSLWKHVHCFLCTPLLRASHGREALAALFNWARDDPQGSGLVDFQFVTGDGPFQQLLVDYLHERGNLHAASEAFNRALFRKRENAEAFLNAALSTGYRKEMRRLGKRLGETGRLESRLLTRIEDLDPWLDQFLELEASGWKGRAGENSAIGLHTRETTFFREAARAALDRRRLQALGLFLDGRPIAMTVNFLTGDGGFHFKIAYDESLAKYSPGVQLELDLVQHAHDNAKLRWLDSCAIPNHPMINRLWPERRTIHNVLVSTGRWRGDLTVSALPLLRWLGRLWRGRKKMQ